MNKHEKAEIFETLDLAKEDLRIFNKEYPKVKEAISLINNIINKEGLMEAWEEEQGNDDYDDHYE